MSVRVDQATALHANERFAVAAETFAKQGYRVFPVAPIGQGSDRKDGKVPYPGTHGFKDATDDLEQIAEWSVLYPDANIGLACEASGLVVLDVDLDLHDPEQAARWQRFREDHQIPTTLTQHTAGGGRHYIFRAELGVRYPGSLSDADGKIADIKHKGYILLAPSVAQSGRREAPGTYEIIDDAPPVDAPGWLAKRTGRARSVENLPEGLEDLARGVREARRRETTDKLLRLLQSRRNIIKSRDEWLRLGLALHAGYEGTRWENEAEAAWIAFSERWEVPLGSKSADFAENADQVWRHATANRHGGVMPATAQKILQRLPALPDERLEPEIPSVAVPVAPDQTIALTGLAGRIADVVRMGNDRDLKVFPQAAALVAMSALAAPRYVLRGPQGLTTLNIYALLLGGTGSGKEAARTATDMVLNAARRSDEKLNGIASDKALHRALSEGGEPGRQNGSSRGARALAIDEGGLQLEAIRKGNHGHQKLLLAFMMQLFGLGLSRLPPHKYADSRNEIPAVEYPRLTVMFTSTPEAFEKASGREDSESGQLNRFLVFKEDGFPPLRDGRVDRDLLRDPPEDIVRASRRFPARTLAQVVANGLGSSETDEVVELSTEAMEAHDVFRRTEVEDMRRKGGVEGESWARAAEYVLRVSGLLALSDAAVADGDGNVTDVTSELHHVELAITIVRRAMQDIVHLARNAGKSEIEQLKDEFLDAIKKYARPDGYARARDVHRDCFRGVPKHVRDGLVAALDEDGEILRDERDTGGRPAVLYAIAKDRGLDQS